MFYNGWIVGTVMDEDDWFPFLEVKECYPSVPELVCTVDPFQTYYDKIVFPFTQFYPTFGLAATCV
jgi:hypothetical protein